MACLAVFFAAALFVNHLLAKQRQIVDKSVMPKGPVSYPTEFAKGMVSRACLNLRLDLDTLAKVANSLMPNEIAVPDQNTGNIAVQELKFSRQSNNRLGVSCKAWSRGYFSHSIGPITFTATAIHAKLAGEADLAFGTDWCWRPNVSLVADITDIDVRPFPDSPARWAINSWLIPSLTKNAGSISVPIKPLVQGLWQSCQKPWVLWNSPRTEVRFLPKGALLKRPELDASSNDLILGVGLEFLTSAVVDDERLSNLNEFINPVPALIVGDNVPVMSDVTLPVAMKLSDLPGLFKEQTLGWEDGSITIHSVELTEKEGMLYARLNLDAKLPSSAPTSVLRELRGTLLTKIKPRCDQLSGLIEIEDFGFSSSTNSMLIDLFGPGLTESLKGELKTVLPKSVAISLLQLENQLEKQVNDFLSDQLKGWTAQMPEISPLVNAAKGKLTQLRLKPVVLQIKDGYLLLAIQVKGEVNLDFE